MPDARDRILIDIDADGDRLLKIKWRQGLPWGKAYSVPRGMLEEFSTQARERLEALVTEALRGRVKETGAILKELALAGNWLYRALFHDPDGGGRATKSREHLKALTGDYEILVSMGVPVHVPWGLVYDGNPEALSGYSGGHRPQPLSRFLVRQIPRASVYYTVDPEGTERPLSGELRVHSVVNQAVLTRTAPFLAECGGPLWDWVLERFGPPMYSQKDWLARWATENSNVGLLYFYSHADGSRIGLGNDTISANDSRAGACRAGLVHRSAVSRLRERLLDRGRQSDGRISRSDRRRPLLRLRRRGSVESRRVRAPVRRRVSL